MDKEAVTQTPCQYKYSVTLRGTCPHPPLAGDEDTFCIFHSQNDGKDKDAFWNGIKEKLGNKDFDFESYYFPPGLVADFSGIEFTDANFEWAIFSDVANFGEAKFLGENKTNFRGSRFLRNGDTSFGWAEFCGKGGTDFSLSTFSGNGRVSFFGATFSGEGSTYFRYAKFSVNGGIYFQNTAFLSNGITDFTGAEFSSNGGIDFSEARFSGKGRTDFSGAVFASERETNFSNATFSGGGTLFALADFSNCDITLFVNARFNVYCEFPQARFPRKSNQFVIFEGEKEPLDLSKCSFVYCNPDRLVFRNFKLLENEAEELWGYSFPLWKRRVILLDEKKINDFIQVYKKVVKEKQGEGNEQIKSETIQIEYAHVESLYRQFKKNLEEEKNWEDAGEFHYGEMECKRKGLTWFWRNFGLLAWYRYLSGYGERPLRAAVSLAILISLCWLVYNFSDDSVHYVTYKNLGTVKEITEPYHSKGYWLGYSIKAVFWHRFGEYCGEPASRKGEIAFFLESLLGPILIALFILALRRRLKR